MGKDHIWLVHNDLSGSEDDKLLVPTGCRHSFWSEDDEWVVRPALGTLSGGLPCREGNAPFYFWVQRITSG